MVKIRSAQPDDRAALVRLIAGFRVALAELRGRPHEPHLEAAAEELDGYLQADYPIFVAEMDDGERVGYLVCRVADDVVWAESLYVEPSHRRRGIAGQLYAEAEHLADELGSETVYNWIHPNNHRIIAFLRKRGYDVLNLVEVRRTRSGEEIEGRIQVGDHQFRY